MVMTISAPDAAAFTLPAACAAGRGQRVGLRLAHVEADARVAGLEQVARHRQAHVAEPDEADPCHAVPLPRSLPAARCRASIFAVIAKARNRCALTRTTIRSSNRTMVQLF